MYAVYKYLNGATASQVLSDVVAILTGTTDVNSLSASCDKSLSSITSTVASGWTVHDAVAGTNAVVVKSAYADAPSLFKYTKIDTNTANYIGFSSSEGWNATTHVATNIAYTATPASNGQPVSFSHAAGGYLYISASERHILVYSLSSGSTYGRTGGYSGCLEYERWSPWDTAAAGYPAFVDLGQTVGGGIVCVNSGVECFGRVSRLKSANGTDVLNTNLTFSTISYFSGSVLFAPANSKIIGSTGQFATPMLPIFASSPSNGSLGGNISSRTNIWMLPNNLGANGDEIIVGGNTYVILGSGSVSAGSNRIAVLKG